MSFILFAVVHTLIGIALIYFYGKLPKAIAKLFIVFFAFSILHVDRRVSISRYPLYEK